MSLQLYIATRKGIWIATAGEDRRTWSLSEPTFLGHQCHHVILDPRDRTTLLAASRQWHLGPTVRPHSRGAKRRLATPAAAGEHLVFPSLPDGVEEIVLRPAEGTHPRELCSVCHQTQAVPRANNSPGSAQRLRIYLSVGDTVGEGISGWKPDIG